MDWVREHSFLVAFTFVFVIPVALTIWRNGGVFLGPPRNGWFEKDIEKTVGEMEPVRQGPNHYLQLTVHALDRSKPNMDVGVDIVMKQPGNLAITSPLALSAAEARRLARLLRAAATY